MFFFLDLFLFGDVLRIVPWDEDHHQTTIGEKMFGTFSKHLTCKSKVIRPIVRGFYIYIQLLVIREVTVG